MAEAQSTEGYPRTRKQRRRDDSYYRADGQVPFASRGTRGVAQEDASLSDVQAIDIGRDTGKATMRRDTDTPATPKMSLQSPALVPDQESATSHRRRRHHPRRATTYQPKQRRSKEPLSKWADLASTYCYEVPTTRTKAIRVVTRRRNSHENENDNDIDTKSLSESGESSDEDRRAEVAGSRDSQHKEKTRYRDEKVSSYVPPGDRRNNQIQPGPLQRSQSYAPRQPAVPEPPSATPHQRSSSSSVHPTESRPSPRRSATAQPTPIRLASYTPSVSNTLGSGRAPSALGSFFGIPGSTPREPERMIECLTCGNDETPRSKSAKLKCGHRMCNACLRRIFKMSITDPQHMPPKCCTDDHISLKHVEKLFDNNFKRTWNYKFQEFSTKNRIYCPEKHCGEWIKPAHIQRDSTGRKYGKCGRCSTKVCCECNGKYHGKKGCRRDEETRNLLRQAKEAGWQRCYNCRNLVELNEGCNHMTCRCKAQFCMICARQWKTCECPWFNYDNMESGPRAVSTTTPIGSIRNFRPINYQAEMLRRRIQERDDEALARQLGATAIHDATITSEHYNGNVGHVHSIGSNAPHFMNENYVRVNRGTIPHAQSDHYRSIYMDNLNQRRRGSDSTPLIVTPVPDPPPPKLRSHTEHVAAWNSTQSNLVEMVVPRRLKMDYLSEATVHAPMGSESQSQKARIEPTAAVLAGLPGRGSGRVFAWRTHVDPVEPPDGVLSM